MILLASLLAMLSAAAQTTSEFACLWRYGEANGMLSASPAKGRVVFMGDSITDNWARMRPGFFHDNDFIGRGIGGQTTSQMLLRFRDDVVNTGASAVVILAGTNDIAGNRGPCTLEEIAGNIASMCEIAQANGVRVVLCSVLPAHRYGWSKDKRPDIEIPKLNVMLEAYAKEQGFTYLDYFSEMVDPDQDNLNGLPLKWSKDGVHPNSDGYEVMESMVMEVLKDEVKAGVESRKGETLSLMSFNVRNGLGLDKDRMDYKRTSEVISSCCTDVVALQELDCGTKRSEGEDVLDVIAKRTGMYGTFAPAIEYGGGTYGVGMLSIEKPLRSATVPLPGREEARVLLMVEFNEYIYCCTHLSLTEEDRMASLQIIEDALKDFSAGTGKPVFIAGDWNDYPDSPFMAKMKKRFDILTDTAIPTFPSNAPASTIDYIARWKGGDRKTFGKVLGSSVPVVPAASDHRPVTVSLK